MHQKDQQNDLRARAQHVLNACHVYAALRRMSVPKLMALRVSSLWERCAHPILYPGATR